MMRRTVFYAFAAAALCVACKKQSQPTAPGDAADTLKHAVAVATVAEQEEPPVLSLADQQLIARIDSLAALPAPLYATPREAMEAFLQAYTQHDAPMLFHVSLVRYGQLPVQNIVDYQHMLLESVARGDNPVSFVIDEEKPDDPITQFWVTLSLANGTFQPIVLEAQKLPDGTWKAAVN